MGDLTDRLTHGVAWMVLLRLTVRSLGLVSTLILVRLLNPADFGIVAMAMVVVAGIELFAAFGFDVALIHNQKADRNDYDTAWTISVIMGLVSAAAIALVAYPAARLYDEPRLVLVFQVIAIASLLEGLKNVGLVEFRKQLQFKKEFIFQLSVKIIGFIFTMAAALTFRSYWALILGILITRFATLILSYIMQPYRPRFCLASFNAIFSFSKWMFINNLLVYFRLRAPDFIIGKLVGINGLGLYSISYEISQLPTTELVAPINRVLLPGLAKIADDAARLCSAFVRSVSTITVVSLPTAVGLAVTAHLFTPIALGEKWLDAIPLVEVLAIYGGVIAILSPIGSVLLAMGRPGVVATLNASNAAIVLPLTYLAAVEYGAIGAAYAMTLVMALFLPIYYLVVSRIVGLTWGDVSGVFMRPVVASAIMYIVVDSFFGGAEANVFNLAVSVFTGATTYAALMAAMWRLAGRPANCGESYLLEQILRRIRRRRIDVIDSGDNA